MSSTSDDSEVTISESLKEALNDRQLVDFQDHRQKFVEWMRENGKDPERHDGLADRTIKNYEYRLNAFYEWLWTQNGGYTKALTTKLADEYVRQLNTDAITQRDGTPYKEDSKRKTVNALQKLYAWRTYQFGDSEWVPKIVFSDDDPFPENRADVFMIDELRRLREGVLEYDTIPAYNDLTPTGRNRWKKYLAQRLGKPKSEVSPTDWERVNTSWKIPSLVLVSIDAGLAPIEVGRATFDWFRFEKETMLIPRSDAAKERDAFEIPLRSDTVDALRRWKKQRKNIEAYDGRDEVWLTRKRNPYSSKSLCNLIRNLCDWVGIDHTDRKIVWYSLRHSIGTYLAKEGDLFEAKDQLRHRNLETTLKYRHFDVEDRKDTLERL